MDVTGEHRRDFRRNLSRANDVGAGREGEVCRTDGCALDAMMDAENAMIDLAAIPSSLIEHLGETGPNVATHVRKTRECDACPAHVRDEGSRLIEYVHARMRQETRVRNLRALVIAWHDEHGNAVVGNATKRLERSMGDRRRHGRTVEDISRVHHEIDVARERGLERGKIIREEIVAAPPAFDARPKRKIEPEMRVGEEKNSDVGGHPIMVELSVFIR
jgi:hypothetical protein